MDIVFAIFLSVLLAIIILAGWAWGWTHWRISQEAEIRQHEIQEKLSSIQTEKDKLIHDIYDYKLTIAEIRLDQTKLAETVSDLRHENELLTRSLLKRNGEEDED